MSVTHHDAGPDAFLSEPADHAEIDQENQSHPHEQDPLLQLSTSADDAVADSNDGLLISMSPALLAGIFVKAFDIAFQATSYSRLGKLAHQVYMALMSLRYSYLLASFGIKRMMFVAYGAFVLGLALCAISISFSQLLGSRFFVGFGSSGISLLSMVVINEIVGSFVTCIEMGTSMAAGPLGAWMYRSFSWHSVLFLEVSFTLTGLGSTLLKQGNPSQLPSRVDVEGFMLLNLAVTTPLIAFTLEDNLLRWTNSVEVTLLILGPLLMVVFVAYEAKLAASPILDMTPIFNIQYLRVLFQVFGVISILNSIVFIIPPYIQVRTFEGSSFEDWALTCVFLGFPVGAIVGGYLIKNEILPVQRIMLANAIALGICCSLFAMRVIKPELSQHAPLLAGFGISTGLYQSCLLYATLSTTQRKSDLGMTLMSTITRSVAKRGTRSSLGSSKAKEGIIVEAMKDLQSTRGLSEGARTAFFLPCSLAAIVIILAAAMNI
ncbi:major facilitator superfamily domain-containing protein [Triangularia setosa]|uniref:Major facilitator superfamily domain-containing protein n=1 Tax=Triangularia setosa TaxID=2587417 RepID=A0AAN6W7B7_9PEZI|nr:major facilitator superfamily domain-containing protein [Podospora setosa]